MCPKAKPAAGNPVSREIVMTRLLDAPRERVFEAMTDPKQVVKWWGPNGFSTTTHEMDVRPGGVWRHTMHGPDGTDYPNKSIFVEIIKPERIVYKHAGGTPEKGGACFGATWTFEDMGGKTKITGRLSFMTSQEREHVEREYQAVEGGKQTLSRLDAFLNQASVPQKDILITRFFDAPRERVWKAWTEASEIERWWGPKGFKTRVEQLDFRVGGKSRYVMIGPDGTEYPAEGVFKEIRPFEKIVSTDEFGDESQSQGLKGLLCTILFESCADGKTKLAILIQHPTLAMRQTHEKMGVIAGWNSSLECLEEHLPGKSAPALVVEKLLDAPAEKVWRALTDKAQMKQWYFDLPEFKPVVGTEFRFSGGPEDRQYLHLCRVTEVIAEKKIAYSWRYDGYEGNSTVSFELFPEGGKTRLKLTHTGLETFPKSNADFDRSNFTEGWTHFIHEGLPNFLERP